MFTPANSIFKWFNFQIINCQNEICTLCYTVLLLMTSQEHPGAGPLLGVPLRDKFKQVLYEPSQTTDPCRRTSLAERMGKLQFDMGSVDLVLVKHMLLKLGKTSSVYKDGRLVSFMFIPLAGCKWQVQNKVSTRWCACQGSGLRRGLGSTGKYVVFVS